MAKIDELETAAKMYKEAFEKAELCKPESKTIDVINGDEKCASVVVVPTDGYIRIYNRSGGSIVTLTIAEGRKLLAALKELYE
jgi:hypothetical protein